MNNGIKRKICLLRLDGLSIHEIAEIVGTTYQTVSNYLRKLPKNNEQLITNPYEVMEEKVVHAICTDYIQGRSVAEIANNRGLSLDSVYSVFWFITARKPIAVKKSVYPCISEWMRKNFVSLKNMAEMIGTTPSNLGHVLSGKKHMSKEMVISIRDVTKIPLHVIFEHEIEAYRNERKAKHEE